MFRLAYTLASRRLVSPCLRSQITKEFHSISYALPFGNKKMGSGSQVCGGGPDEKALLERCGKDKKIYNAIFNRYDGDLKDVQDFLDSVEKGWMEFEFTSDGELATRVTKEGKKKFEEDEAKIRQNSAY